MNGWRWIIYIMIYDVYWWKMEDGMNDASAASSLQIENTYRYIIASSTSSTLSPPSLLFIFVPSILLWFQISLIWRDVFAKTYLYYLVQRSTGPRSFFKKIDLPTRQETKKTSLYMTPLLLLHDASSVVVIITGGLKRILMTMSDGLLYLT